MAEDKSKDFMGPQDAEVLKAKKAALDKAGPSKISQELKEKQVQLAKQRDARVQREWIVYLFLVGIPVAMIVFSFVTKDSQMALKCFKWGFISLFVLSPGYALIKAMFFRKSMF
jgi:hypothetical protein